MGGPENAVGEPVGEHDGVDQPDLSPAVTASRASTPAPWRRWWRSAAAAPEPVGEQPDAGASSDGAVKKKNTSPAWALLRVSVLTQMPIASHRLESPNSENTCPAR